jgi:hypothetical protein
MYESMMSVMHRLVAAKGNALVSNPIGLPFWPLTRWV